MEHYILDYRYEGMDELRAKYLIIADKMDELAEESRKRIKELDTLIEDAENHEVRLVKELVPADQWKKSHDSGRNS